MAMFNAFFILLTVLGQLWSLGESRLHLLTKRERENLIDSKYDRALAPVYGPRPVEVGVKIYVLNIRSIKEADLVIMKWSIMNGTIYKLLPQTLIMDIFLHLYWKDYRINLPYNLAPGDKIILDNNYRSQLWIPTSYFKNSIGGSLQGVLFPSLYFTIDANREVFMAARTSVHLTCDMRFDNYPHDIQECTIDLMSLTNTNDTVQLKWLGFKLTSNLFLTQYRVRSHRTEYCTRKYDVGSFSCLKGVFELERLIGHFMIKLYIPSILIVVMTFVGYYIPVTAYPARVALNITALLALITLQLHITSTIHTAYVVSINIWMIICTAFVFMGLIEYALAIIWAEKQKKTEKDAINPKRHLPPISPSPNPRESPGANQSPSGGPENGTPRSRSESILAGTFFRNFFIQIHGLEGNLIDSTARKIFPIAFIICGIIYMVVVSLYKYTNLFH